MRRRKHLEEVDNSQRWIVSYADLLTLLFAFFVVMYAVSSVSLDKLKKFASATDQAFNQQASGPEKQALPGDPIVDKVEQFAEKDIIIRQNNRWAELEIKSQALFPSGSAKLTPTAKILLARLATTLKDTKHYISVEGHTDDRAIRTTQFPSNWELSASRAAAVVRLLTQHGVIPSKIHAVGFGRFYPIASNQTKVGRAENRRVVIVLTNEKTSPRLLQPSMALKAKVVRPQLAAPTDVRSITPQTTVVQPKKALVKPNPNEIAVPVVKAVRLKSGGLKFTSGTAKVRKGDAPPLIIEENAKE